MNPEHTNPDREALVYLLSLIKVHGGANHRSDPAIRPRTGSAGRRWAPTPATNRGPGNAARPS